MFNLGTQTDGQRAEEHRGRGGPIRVHNDGRQALWRFWRKTVIYPGKRKASATSPKGVEKDGLVVRQCLQAYRFDGLGLKTITRLFWADRSPDKIETLKASDGRVEDIARVALK